MDSEYRITEEEYLKQFRTRWRRWLGNKTRRGEPHWTSLLSSSWLHWATGVLDGEYLSWRGATRETVKAFWVRAIDQATLRELQKLDNIYAGEKLGL